jgi:hypothetical protein
MSGFIPSDYSEPTSGGGRYTKIEEGKKVKLRILASPIQGWLRWTVEPKPIRWRKEEEQPQRHDWKDDAAKLFWAMPIWNYITDQVELWEVTQKSIRQELVALANNEDWGDPHEYDITVSRTGSGLETKYQVHPSPHRQLDDFAATAYAKTGPKIEALFTGDDPFAA